MYRDPDLLRLAQGQKCLLECHPYCDGDEGSTTVAAHSNELIHGKGRGLKADDCMSVWACHKCHMWIDIGPMSKQEKKKLFDKAWFKQVNEWANIAETMTIKPWKVDAALRVLQHIGKKR
jgi:uncharacterized CHY-type Zn-finger protein